MNIRRLFRHVALLTSLTLAAGCADSLPQPVTRKPEPVKRKSHGSLPPGIGTVDGVFNQGAQLVPPSRPRREELAFSR